MTYPTGTGTVISNYGPGVPNGAASGAAPPYPAPGAAANVSQSVPSPATYNAATGIQSTREALNSTIENVPQQGSRYITNAASVTLAGLKAGRDQAYYTGLDTGSLNG
jgi:hypothetical protein